MLYNNYWVPRKKIFFEIKTESIEDYCQRLIIWKWNPPVKHLDTWKNIPVEKHDTESYKNHQRIQHLRSRSVCWLMFYGKQPLLNVKSYIYIYIYIYHHVVPPARISLTLSRHFSLSFIAFCSSSGLHPVSSHNCCMYVRAGRPAFAWPYAGVHWSTSLMSSFLLLQQCPACLVRLTCIVFVMGGKWPYSWCLVGCFARTCSILLSTFLCNCRLVSSSAVELASK